MPQLALGVLAAIGAQWCWSRARRWPAGARVALAAAVVAFMVAESAMPIVLTRVPDSTRATAVNELLARRPDGVVVELPVGSPADGWRWAYVEAPRQALSTIDWNERVGGYSGFAPPGYDELAATLETFPSRSALDAMRRLGVRYVVLRLALPGRLQPEQEREVERDGVGLYSPERARAIVDQVRAEGIGTVERVGDAYLIELDAPRSEGAARALPSLLGLRPHGRSAWDVPTTSPNDVSTNP
jgi:hypothetical protein